MDRRKLLTWMGGLGAAASAGASVPDQSGSGDSARGGKPLQLAQAAAPAHEHDHAAMMAAPAVPAKYAALVVPYQDCIRASQVCIAHCQQSLAQGDKSLGDCLRTALDTEVLCTAVAKLANLNSQFTPALAKQSIAVMQVCVDACKEHVDHHAQCKACHDACLKAIDAARRSS